MGQILKFPKLTTLAELIIIIYFIYAVIVVLQYFADWLKIGQLYIK